MVSGVIKEIHRFCMLVDYQWISHKKKKKKGERNKKKKHMLEIRRAVD